MEIMFYHMHIGALLYSLEIPAESIKLILLKMIRYIASRPSIYWI